MQDPMKYRSREILVESFLITLHFERHVGNTPVEMPVKFYSVRAFNFTNDVRVIFFPKYAYTIKVFTGYTRLQIQ